MEGLNQMVTFQEVEGQEAGGESDWLGCDGSYIIPMYASHNADRQGNTHSVERRVNAVQHREERSDIATKTYQEDQFSK